MKIPVIGVTTSYEDMAHQEKQTVGRFYIQNVIRGGGSPKILNFQDPLWSIDRILDGLDGLLIIGGRDVEPCLYGRERLPECGEASVTKDLYEMELIRHAVKRDIPLLGICRGIQVINVALGGTLIQDLPTSSFGTLHQQKPGNIYWHDVDIDEDTAFGRLMGSKRIATNSYHHQAIDDIAPCLRVTARCTRDGVIEGVEGKDSTFLMATQWHPEHTATKDKYSVRFFEALARHAGASV